MHNKEKRKNYEAILLTLNENSEAFDNDNKIDIRDAINLRIKSLDIYDLFKIDFAGMPLLHYSEYVNVADCRAMGLYSESTRRKISWSDDGTQPEDEWLYSITFPTGGYIFGDDYPTKAFNEFFVHLKTYKPKYSDSHNNSLYFTPENASAIHKDFNSILDKFRTIAFEECKQKRILDAEEKLRKLKE